MLTLFRKRGQYWLCFAFSLLISLSASAGQDHNYSELFEKLNRVSGVVNYLTYNPDKLDEYRQLAEHIGLDYDVEYSWDEFTALRKQNQLVITGQYELLPSSTGGIFLSPRARLGWESIYYANYDITVIYQMRSDGVYSSIKLLKLANGLHRDLSRL